MAVSEDGVADRLRRLQGALEKPVDAAFAVRLGVSPQRLSNVLNGAPLGKDMAFKIVQAVPGVTTDWLWFGNARGMPLELVDGLGEGRMGKTAPESA